MILCIYLFFYHFWMDQMKLLNLPFSFFHFLDFLHVVSLLGGGVKGEIDKLINVLFFK